MIVRFPKHVCSLRTCEQHAEIVTALGMQPDSALLTTVLTERKSANNTANKKESSL